MIISNRYCGVLGERWSSVLWCWVVVSVVVFVRLQHPVHGAASRSDETPHGLVRLSVLINTNDTCSNYLEITVPVGWGVKLE